METAVVTGTSTGIGFATTLHLARNGYRVFAGMRNLAKADPLRAAAAEAKLPIEVISIDVTSADSVTKAFAPIGPVDVLVNNAGIGGATPLELTPEDEHVRMFDTNYFGAIRCIQAVLPSMRERRRGTIVNITSIAGHAIHPFAGSAYSTSKAALSALTREMAVEFAALGVRVNAVAPGEIETAMVGPEYESLIPRIPMHRMGTPEEVAAAVFQLCNPDFSYVTGTEIFVTGGQHLF